MIESTPPREKLGLTKPGEAQMRYEQQFEVRLKQIEVNHEVALQLS